MQKLTENQQNLLKNSNPLPLAFLGDAVHTLFVREYVFKKFVTPGNLSAKAAALCKASHQAKVMHKLLPILDETEQDLVRRARNCKPKHQAKNATSADYSFATAFEALVGYLYVFDKKERLNQILSISCQSEVKDAN